MDKGCERTAYVQTSADSYLYKVGIFMDSIFHIISHGYNEETHFFRTHIDA